MSANFSTSYRGSIKLGILLILLGLIGCDSNNRSAYKAEISPIVLKINSGQGENVLLYSEDTLKSRKGENISVVSWNIQYLGRTKTPEDIFEISNTLRNFDLVAIQEVVAKDPAGAQAVARIADELNRMGSKWDYQISNPTKSPSVYMSERYAFLWKTSKVNIVHRAYLDEDLEELCYREPFIAKFNFKG